MSIQERNVKRQAQSLERNLKGILHQMKHDYDEFREKCRVFHPERGYSPAAAREVKEKFYEVGAKMSEARALQQLLRGKYKQHVQVDLQKQRELEELYIMYRKDYRYFEQNQRDWQQQVSRKGEVPRKILSHLEEIYQKHPTLPSILLCFGGELPLVETVARRLRLGSRDKYEQEGGEHWVFLAGIRPQDDSILQRKLVDTLFRGLDGSIKGVAHTISDCHHWSEEVLRKMRQVLDETRDKEIRIV